VRHFGYRVRVGTPAANHICDKHNYMHDLNSELASVWLIEGIAERLRELRLEGNTYVETYLDLADAIKDTLEKFNGFVWNDSTRGFFHQMAHNMRTWTRTVRTIMGKIDAPGCVFRDCWE
jgi:hypothetical protein